MLTSALTDRVMAGRTETAPEGSRLTKHELGEGPGMERRAIAFFQNGHLALWSGVLDKAAPMNIRTA